MKFILIVLSALALVSCKGTHNQTSSAQVVSAYEQKAFLIIPHNDDSSILREKLLHLKLNQHLKLNSLVKPEPLDEFKLSSEKFETNRSEQLEFQRLLDSSAEIVVSYSDRTEIYFVPTGIQRDQALMDLHLKSEPGRILDWAEGTPGVLSKGTAYYLLSASKEDMLLNDRLFSIEKIEPTSDSVKVYQFVPSQKITLQFSFDYFVKETAVTNIVSKTRVTCKAEMREAGLCDPCSAQIEQTTGKLLKDQWSLQSFGLVLVINGKEYSAADFNPVFSEKKDSMMITLDLASLKLEQESKTVEIQVSAPRIASKTKVANAFNYAGNCSLSFPPNVLDLTPVAKMTYQMDVYGRKISL